MEEAKNAKLNFVRFTPPKIVKDAEPAKPGKVSFAPPKIAPDSDDRIFTKVEDEASFPGGPAKWAAYIQKAISADIDKFDETDFGTCVIRFIVDKDGTVRDVEATTMKGSHLAQVSVDAIRKGPKWIPAMQNNIPVNAYRLQPVTLSSPEK